MGSIEAISWFLIERNTIKRFTPTRLPCRWWPQFSNPPQAAGKQLCHLFA
jgi:hypothetical protein